MHNPQRCGSPSRSIYTRLVAGLIFPLQERLKRHRTVAALRSMERSQWFSPQELLALQKRRLRRLIDRAYHQVPYYRALFDDNGIDPREIVEPSDLQRLPFLTKPLIREHSDALKAADAVGLSRFNTGGSSGEPLVFYIGDERVSHDVAAKWRATRWWGVDIGDPEVVIWGSPIELGAQDRLRTVRDGLMRTTLLPAFEMSAAKIEQFLATIRKMGPAMLFGYPSSISLLARHARKSGQRMDDLGIKVVFVTAERLYQEQVEVISSVFGCPVANGYGGRDAGFLAHACPEGGLHITAEDVILEIVDREGGVLPPGEAGEVVVTHLATGDFPFIRYRTGDVAVLSEHPCSCGRGLPCLSEVQGRTTDFIVAADGTIMHGLALIYVLRDLDAIESFKIVQESLELTRILVVANERFGDSQRSAIVDGIAARLGPEVEVRVEQVDEIAPERSGKFRYVVSKVTL